MAAAFLQQMFDELSLYIVGKAVEFVQRVMLWELTPHVAYVHFRLAS